MSALRLARAATGRDRIAKFAGAYHGHVDGLLAEAGSGLATQGIPASPGVTAAQAADTRGGRRGARCPRASSPRSSASPTPPTWAWCRRPTASSRRCARRADETGALLVFDEVISGFRVAPGGAQEREGVTPDLSILGKVIGGGLPAAAYAGPARADGADRARRRRLPGGHAVGQSARHRRGPGHAAACWTPTPTSGSSGSTAALADGPARRGRRGRRAGAGLSHDGAAHRLLLRGARA